MGQPRSQWRWVREAVLLDTRAVLLGKWTSMPCIDRQRSRLDVGVLPRLRGTAALKGQASFCAVLRIGPGASA